MKGTWFMLFLLSACCTGFIAQSRAESPQGIFPYTYHEKTLDNKLKVIMIPMDSPRSCFFLLYCTDRKSG